MNDYYSSLSESEYFENKLYISVCYKPFSAEDKVTHFLSRKKGNKNIFEEPINDMNEICGRLSTYLSRFHSRRLGLYEENGVVYSDQLSLFQKLLSGRWQKVRVTNSRFTRTWVVKMCSLVTMQGKSPLQIMPGIFVALRLRTTFRKRMPEFLTP
jgi:type IV secretion system protein VirB4